MRSAGTPEAEDVEGGRRLFLSYARADQPKVALLVQALQARGHHVWWDRQLTGGSAFSDSIERELAAADAVVVAWSAASVRSDWVRDEATVGRDRGCLVPVSLDGTLPPLGFRQYHTIDLARWHDEPRAPTLAEIEAAIAAASGSAAPEGPAAPLKPGRRLPMPALAAAVALVAVLGVLGWRQFATPEAAPAATAQAPAPAAPLRAAAAVAVLPFADLSAKRDQAYFADGVAEEITMRLARDGRLKVIGRSTAAAIRDRAADRDYVRGALGVGHLLEGSVREAGGRLRIAVRLIDTQDGAEKWSESYDRKAGDIFAVQDEVAGAVAGRLAANVAAPAGAAEASPNHTTSPENYRKYLLGRSLMRERTKSSINRAATLFAEVMAADPDYAPTFAAFAYATGLRHHYDEISMAEYRRLGPPAAERALALDPNLAEAWLAKGQLPYKINDGLKAVEAARRAVALDPDNPEVLGPASNMIGSSGQPGSSAEQYRLLQRAVRLDPLFFQTQQNLQGSALRAGDEATARRALVAFEKVATRKADVDRLEVYHYYLFRRPADYIRLFRQKKGSGDFELEAAGEYRNALAFLFDRATLANGLQQPDLQDRWRMGDWAGILRALESPERQEISPARALSLSAQAFSGLGRFDDLVGLVQARHPLPWQAAETQWEVRSALTVAQAFRKAGDPAGAEPYVAYARSNLARMRADAFGPAALVQAEAELALADGNRAAALRHLELSAAQPSYFNICYGPDWIGTSPAWEDLRADPGFTALVQKCRALINRQRAEIGLPPANLP